MKLPIIPIFVACLILAGAVYLFNSLGSDRPITFGPPRMSRLAGLDGTETEVAIAPDGNRYLVVASGDIWLLNLSDGTRQQVTQTTENESFPTWTPDGNRFTFTRGPDTHVVSTNNIPAAEVFKADATFLSWSGTGRVAFIRNRALWTADPTGLNEQEAVQADPNPEVQLRSPRFSPDSQQLSYIRTTLNLRGEVWLLNLTDGMTRALIADRPAENPMDTGWSGDGRYMVYLTDRSGAFALWAMDFQGNTIVPITVTLNGTPLERVGISVKDDRIVVPRHFLNSDIALSDGTAVISTEKMEFEPAVTPDGKLMAYVVENDNRHEIWTAGIDGSNPVFRTLGREPRFAPNGYQIVYTHTNLAGNQDLWKLDIRNGASETVTDADELDIHADWSPSGRDIVFSSGRGGTFGIWTIAAAGGKRLRLNEAGYYPRYSPRGDSLLFWSANSLWSMDAAGNNPRSVRADVAGPVPAVATADGPKYYRDPEISGGREIWPNFAVLPDGRFVIAPIQVLETSLWAIDLTYTQTN